MAPCHSDSEMSYETFESFADRCKDHEKIKVVEHQQETELRNDAIIIGNLKEVNGMDVCEILVAAYDSGFEYGPMAENWYNGSLLIRD